MVGKRVIYIIRIDGMKSSQKEIHGHFVFEFFKNNMKFF